MKEAVYLCLAYEDLPNKDFNIVKEVQSILQDEFFSPFGEVNECPILAISHDYISLIFTILGIHSSWIGGKREYQNCFGGELL